MLLTLRLFVRVGLGELIGLEMSESIKLKYDAHGDFSPETYFFALVAQLVEHRFCKAVVASSSLVGGLTKLNFRLILFLSV